MTFGAFFLRREGVGVAVLRDRGRGQNDRAGIGFQHVALRIKFRVGALVLGGLSGCEGALGGKGRAAKRGGQEGQHEHAEGGFYNHKRVRLGLK